MPEGLADDAVDFLLNTIYGFIFEDDEDCKSSYIVFGMDNLYSPLYTGLTVNVIKPANAGPGDKLPVAAVSQYVLDIL